MAASPRSLGLACTTFPKLAAVRRGIAQVMEGRHVFEHLTVEERLRAGASPGLSAMGQRKRYREVRHCRRRERCLS